MTINDLPIIGCKQILLAPFRDQRGSLVKTFERETFTQFGLETSFTEEFHTTSHRGVIRGMHFQAPPYDCAKIVSCLSGRIIDVLLDLRIQSPTYKHFISQECDQDNPTELYIPRGIAHGYQVLSESAVVLYRMTRPYVPQADSGIRWDSFGFQWPLADPIVSDRDSKFPTLDTYSSPFNILP